MAQAKKKEAVTSPNKIEDDVKKLFSLVEDMVAQFNNLLTIVEKHVEHIETPGINTTTPRRQFTYEVKEDGEKLALIAKQQLGNPGRYIEICALNGIETWTELKKGQLLKLPL